MTEVSSIISALTFHDSNGTKTWNGINNFGSHLARRLG